MSKELEDRFLLFAAGCRDFCRKIDLDIINREYVKQLIRSSGSIGANYLEASDSLGKQDELMKLKTSRRESKESAHWLFLITTHQNQDLESLKMELVNEVQEINKILSAIILKLTNK